MNKPKTLFIGKKRIVVVSLFSGMDIFLFGILKAFPDIIPVYAVEKDFWISQIHRSKFKRADGTPVMESLIEITPEEYKYKKTHLDENGKPDMADEVGIIGGVHFRTKLIQEISGADIWAHIVAVYGGRDVIVIVIGGPPCQGYSLLNNNNKINKDDPRNRLVFEWLRILQEISESSTASGQPGNVIGLMEEVPSFGPGKYEEIYNEFLDTAKKLPFQIGELPMCSLHYQGNQNRLRRVMQMVHNDFNAQPVFPVADEKNVKRVRDFLPIDYFIMGGWDRLKRNSDHFMQTVTGGSPSKFFIGDVERAPFISELLLCQGIEQGEYPIPSDIPEDRVKQAIGNGVCAHVAYALAKSVVEEVLRLKPDGLGFFIPINEIPDTPITPLVESATDNTSPSDEASPAGVIQPLIETITGITATSDTVDQDSVAPEIQTCDVKLADQQVPALVVNEVEPAITVQAGKTGPLKQPARVNETKNSPAVIRPVKPLVSGHVLYQGPSVLNGEEIVAILTFKSKNVKTGDMAQLTVLTTGMNPLEAVQTGYDEAICGSCPLMQSKQGACYVEIGKAPANIWKAWRNGAYSYLPVQDYEELSGLALRITSYGDPAALPGYIFDGLRKHIKKHTGYTHAWRSEKAAGLKDICMASIGSEQEAQEAQQMGWRTYRILKAGEQLMTKEIMCPNETHGVQCVKCQLCRGTSHPAKNIAIPVHGALQKKFKPEILPVPANKAALLRAVRKVSVSTALAAGGQRPPRVVSSTELRKMKFPAFEFDGKWKELLGNPSTNFHCVIHGMSGHGKSTLAVQLAKYLSGFGKVRYVSGEEQIEGTLLHKFENNDVSTDLIDVSDEQSFEQLMTWLPRDVYSFIFIDSLNTMKIDATRLREIKAAFKSSAIITICQATKAGEMRGSYEIIHDSDIVVKVTSGVAETIKNRFKQIGMKYEIFQYTNSDDAEVAYEEG